MGYDSNRSKNFLAYKFPFKLKCGRFGEFPECDQCKSAHEDPFYKCMSVYPYAGIANFENWVRYNLSHRGNTLPEGSCWLEIMLEVQ